MMRRLRNKDVKQVQTRIGLPGTRSTSCKNHKVQMTNMESSDSETAQPFHNGTDAHKECEHLFFIAHRLRQRNFDVRASVLRE